MKKMCVIVGLVSLTSLVCAEVSIITGVKSAEGWLERSAASSEMTLDTSSSIKIESEVFSGFRGITNVVGVLSSEVVYGEWTTDKTPVADEALTDHYLNTGVLNVSDDVQYWLGEKVGPDHVIALLWNGAIGGSQWYDQPQCIQAYDKNKKPVGQPVEIRSIDRDHFCTMNIYHTVQDQVYGDRGLFGVLVEVSDFGGNAEDIAYVSLSQQKNQNTMDMLYVGTSAISGIETLGLLVSF